MAKKSTLVAFVAKNCANATKGMCRGASSASDNYGPFAMPLPKCLLSLGLPCSYFERCVLPSLQRNPKMVGIVASYSSLVAPLFRKGKEKRIALADELDDIEDDILRGLLWRHPFISGAQGLPVEHTEKQRLCECGNVLPKYKHFCADCLKKRRKANYRARRKQANKKVGTNGE